MALWHNNPSARSTVFSTNEISDPLPSAFRWNRTVTLPVPSERRWQRVGDFVCRKYGGSRARFVVPKRHQNALPLRTLAGGHAPQNRRGLSRGDLHLFLQLSQQGWIGGARHFFRFNHRTPPTP